MDLYEGGLLIAAIDLMLCLMCAVGAPNWRQVVFTLVAFPASIIGCLRLCSLFHAPVALIICDVLNFYALSMRIPYLDKCASLKRTASRNPSANITIPKTWTRWFLDSRAGKYEAEQ
jgi:hypothetical protein